MGQELRQLDQVASWKFDESIAQSFVDHARKHIPGYDRVIDKSVQACQDRLTPSSSIIDVGCATGETLTRLAKVGFNNLAGVDTSQAMLDHCRAPARLYFSDRFPPGPWDAVLCNWTLHFIKDKTRYLTDIQTNLSDSGFLILSDKTNLDPLPIHHYHEFKRRSGVSELEIRHKELSVRDIMHINDPSWYLDTLARVGFKRVYVIDADWCFTTFFCTK